MIKLEKEEEKDKVYKIKSIRKRDGRVVEFAKEKITNAVFKAAQSVGGKDIKKAEEVADKVITILEYKFSHGEVPTVEEVQDIVETVLIKSGHAKTAKAYILYRRQRQKVRETKSLLIDVNNTISSYMDKLDWKVKENSNEQYSFSGLLLYSSGKIISNYVLNEIYTPDIAGAHKKGYIHIHDLTHGVVGYCAGWSIKNLLLKGFGGVKNKVDCKPAKHLSTVVHQMVNYIGCLQMEFAGAQAFSVHPKETIVIKDQKNNIEIIGIEEFFNKFDTESEFKNGIGYKDIINENYFALSFSQDGKNCWKRIKKVIRHPVTDPLHMIKTNKGIVSVSKSHSVFSLNTHHYLGEKENDLLGYIVKKGELFSYNLPSIGSELNINAPEKMIQKFKNEGLIANQLLSYRNDPGRHYAVYRPNFKKGLVLKKTVELDNTAKEVKTKNEKTDNLAALSKIKLEEKSKVNVIDIINNNPKLKKIIWVKLTKKQADDLKEKIQKKTSLRKLSIKLGYCKSYVWSLLKRRLVPITFYENFGEFSDILLTRFRDRKAINTVLEGEKLELLIKLIGWYLTEGWRVHKHSIGISQKGKYVKEILNIADKLGVRYFTQSHCSGKKQIIMGGVIPALISGLCGEYSNNKKIPSFIFNLQNNLKEIFVNELIKGDGYDRDEGVALVSTSNKLITGLNLIAISLGYRTSIKTRHIENFEKKVKGERFTRYDLILHNKKNYGVVGYNEFESSVIHSNEELKTNSLHEYDLSVEDTETFVGGVGLFALHNSSVDTYLAPFIKAEELKYKEVKQAMQQLVFSLNIPSRWGSQYPFTNLTFDWNAPEDVENEKAIVGGKRQEFSYGDCQKEMDIINKAFLEVMKEGDAYGRIFTFPIPTYNITKNFDWDSENAKLLFEVTAKYGTPYFQSYIGSGLDPKSIRAMCCRLNLNQVELMNRPGNMWGPGDNTGSVGVVTMNMNRIGYEAKTKEEFFEKLGYYMVIAKDSLETKRKIVERNLKNGLMPYSKVYLGTFRNHFSTIGLCGMNECCLNFLGKDIASEEGKQFTIETLKFMKDKIKEFQKETGSLYNLEATPAESTSYRLAKLDKEFYPKIITSGDKTPFLTNSTQLPVDYTDDVIEAIEHQNDIQPLYTGGTIFHSFFGEKLEGAESVKRFIKKIAYNTKLPYFSITPTFSVCPEHGYIKGKIEKCSECGKPTEVYSRIVGYFRPVSNWNPGKKEEFSKRVVFSEQKGLEKEFVSPIIKAKEAGI